MKIVRMHFSKYWSNLVLVFIIKLLKYPTVSSVASLHDNNHGCVLTSQSKEYPTFIDIGKDFFSNSELKRNSLPSQKLYDIRGPISFLNTKITEIQESLTEKITRARDRINDGNGFNHYKRNSQSYSIIIGHIISVYATLERREFQIENMNQIYEYVNTMFYRLGYNCVCSFLVRSPIPEILNCGEENYLSTLKKYNLDSGVDVLINKFGLKGTRSLIKEFDKMIRLELSCILKKVDSYPDAAEVDWSLKNLKAAYEARLKAEKRNT